MKREELIAMGISEENADKIMADYGSSVQRANAKAEQYKAKADKADELQSQLDDLNSQGKSELEKANNRIAELEKRDAVRTQRANAMEKFGITAEQASKVVTDDGATDYEVLGQIFADGKKTAVAEYEKQKLADTPNPNGGNGGGSEELSKGAEMAQKYNQNNVITV